MKRRRRLQQGVSLLEVLASLTLFAIVAAATSTLSTTTIRKAAENRHAMAAAFLAQRQMETVRGHDYQNISSGTITETLAGKAYTITTTVVPNAPATGISTITVRVTWNAPVADRSQSTARYYEIQTYYTDITA